jgi:hypothetical protein
MPKAPKAKAQLYIAFKWFGDFEITISNSLILVSYFFQSNKLILAKNAHH